LILTNSITYKKNIGIDESSKVKDVFKIREINLSAKYLVTNMMLDYLTTHISLSSIIRGFVHGFVIYKNGALDLQPQVIRFTSCLPMVGGSLRVFRLLSPLKLVANNYEIIVVIALIITTRKSNYFFRF
jgi:hypothetical protein